MSFSSWEIHTRTIALIQSLSLPRTHISYCHRLYALDIQPLLAGLPVCRRLCVSVTVWNVNSVNTVAVILGEDCMKLK